jgi:Ni,Fe-hydrogenase III large subunit
MSAVPFSPGLAPERFREGVALHLEQGARFAGLFASALGEQTRLVAALSHDGRLVIEQTLLPAGERRYDSLSTLTPAAQWYEREIHDLFALEPRERHGLDPLVFPFTSASPRPRLGTGVITPRAQIDLAPLSVHLRGEGVFTMSYGPVRSGVFETIEYVVETPGEDIPHLDTRVWYKHRGIEERFESLNVDDGVLLAERYEGVASVAHAVAFCAALEHIGGVTVPHGANLVRLVHLELERIANHLDSTIRHTEAAGQAVAFARLSAHKERIQRLRGELCGSRFGRGVVIPGGVSGGPAIDAIAVRKALAVLEARVRADTTLLMKTPSFLDRLRGTGVLALETIRRAGALGPVARGSGYTEDIRYSRPYGAYQDLAVAPPKSEVDGDALARQRVRLGEIESSFALIRMALQELERMGESSGSGWAVSLPIVDGEAFASVEGPQGELLTWVEVRNGRLARVKPRSASFHNLALFHVAFPQDILTDFAFIEASFGLSIAGVAG